MRDTDPEGLSRLLGPNSERNSLSISVEEGAKTVSKSAVERDDLLLRSNYYKVFKENGERKLLERYVILKTMKGSVR